MQYIYCTVVINLLHFTKQSFCIYAHLFGAYTVFPCLDA